MNRQYHFSFIFLITLIITSCNPGTPLEKSGLFLNEYPELYQEAIMNRDENALKPFLSHSDQQVRKTAWLSLGKTVIDDTGEYIEIAKEQDTHEAWFALSFHPSDTGTLRELEQHWDNGELKPGPVCRYFAAHGDLQTLELLSSKIEVLRTEPECAFAVGNILTRVEIPEIRIPSYTKAALSSNDESVQTRMLYGFYRNNLNSFSETSGYLHVVSNQWVDAGRGVDPQTDKYMIRILGKEGLLLAAQVWTADELQNELQLAIEMANVFSSFNRFEDDLLQPVQKLLKHKNPHVLIRLMDSLHNLNGLPESILNHIESGITKKTRNGEIFTASLQLLNANSVDISPYIERLLDFLELNPYLARRTLLILQAVEPAEDVTDRILNMIRKGGVTAVQAMNTLGQFEIPAGKRDEINEIVWEILESGNRSLAYSSADLLMKEEIFTGNDFEKLRNSLNHYSLPEDIEVYQALARVFVNRYGEQSAGLLDSLANLNYAPLNRTLDNLGADVEIPATVTEFRSPDWDRLYNMGTRPYWILETDKGEIEIKLDPFTAPATVSAIDSLTRAGAYNGIPFHRVVPNFVIQGGDIESQDGFGGPDFTLPTEPSLKPFDRGAVGIASAGPDTEGSQFFIMHQWAPHLNGNYTLFGNVTRGMDVVDRIQAGDRVVTANIELR